VGSKEVILSIPQNDDFREFQKSKTLLPTGVIAPKPVTTTLLNIFLFKIYPTLI
jgi:hypothetical protein